MPKLINKYLIAVLLLAAFILRISLSPFGNNPDILSLADWGKWIFYHGTLGFYENQVWTYAWPTQFPVANLYFAFAFIGYDASLNLMRFLTFNVVPHLAPGHMLWWFDWVKWWETALFKPTNFLYGFIIWLKVIPIISDLIIGFLLFKFGKAELGVKKAAILASMFLFLPFSWYLSALWGQYDQFVTLLIFACFLLLYPKNGLKFLGLNLNFPLSAILLFITIELKPTMVFFVPLYGFYFFYKRPKILELILSVVLSLLTFYLTTAFFADKNPFLYIYNVVFPKVFFDNRWALTTKAFNFWQIFYPSAFIQRATVTFLGIPALIWGYLFLAIIYITSAKVLAKGFLKHLFAALYIVSAGSYIFGTSMLDRYFLPGVVFMGFLVIFHPRLLSLWVVSALLFSFNLFYSWGFPFLTPDKVWLDPVIIAASSIIQVAVFIAVLYQIGVFPMPKIKNYAKIGS